MQVGDTAPDFCSQTLSGEPICLKDFTGQQAVVLFFYPRDGSPVCTKQACSFRDAYEQFVSAGAVVIGVSSDDQQRHQTFAQNNRLPFELLSDESGELRKLFAVPKTLGLFPGRVTYVIDKQGRIAHIFNSQLNGEKHVTEALRIVQELQP